ncbi:helix-turn-helix domain-containing protein [Haloechinothrix sp. YIM 98757]|uniref:Helix-turn-helix domain-containing protein n=1 Tax=Haloechinothrix aidingensis TaxID=2752311 RepID=A0A838A7H3_9PSEU|nr:helix-turn-helix domain-containing protein [Haloechinothrix aidingensis]MBA0124229.1 helix-turn-helix domain-containing protein [Haloechinothrix aidingensis]
MTYSVTDRPSPPCAQPRPRTTGEHPSETSPNPSLSELAQDFRPYASRLARAVINGVRQHVPAYAGPLDEVYGEIVLTSVRAVILRGIDAIVEPNVSRDDWTAMFRGIGEMEFRAGRPVETMQAACRIGTRIAARHVTSYAKHRGVPADTVRLYADTIAVQSSKLTTAATEGYEHARSTATRTGERERARLLELLVTTPPAGEQDLVTAATEAGWELPDTVSAVALQRPREADHAPPADLGTGVLVDLDSAEPCLIAAADDPLLRQLTSALPGWRAAVGPPARPDGTHQSLRVARRALDLSLRQLLPDSQVIDCTEHETTLMLLADDSLGRMLVDSHLAPLRELTRHQRDRMLDTLHAWLSSRGQVASIAAQLRIHPQTVRYRMRQLDKLFGSRLTDPRHRFELALAVRTARLLDVGAR